MRFVTFCRIEFVCDFVRNGCEKEYGGYQTKEAALKNEEKDHIIRASSQSIRVVSVVIS